MNINKLAYFTFNFYKTDQVFSTLCMSHWLCFTSPILVVTCQSTLPTDTVILAEGNSATALLTTGVTSLWASVDHTITAHVPEVVKGLGVTAFVVFPVAVWAAINCAIAALAIQVIEGYCSAALVVYTRHTVGVRAGSDVAITTHQVGVVKFLISTLLDGT